MLCKSTANISTEDNQHQFGCDSKNYFLDQNWQGFLLLQTLRCFENVKCNIAISQMVRKCLNANFDSQPFSTQHAGLENPWTIKLCAVTNQKSGLFTGCFPK